MGNDQYDILLSEIRKLSDQVSDTNFAIEKLNEKLQDLTIRLERVESETNQTRGAINQSSERIKNKVSDVVEPVIGATMDLAAQIKKSKTVIIKDKSKSIWQKIKEKLVK